MRLLSILIIGFLLAFCSGNKEKELNSTSELSDQVVKDTLGNENDIPITNVETLNLDKGRPSPFIESPDQSSDGYNNAIEPATFVESTNIYADWDVTSQIIGTIGFNTPVKINLSNISSLSSALLEIDWNNKKGFIVRDNISTHTFTKKSKNGPVKYFVKSYTEGELRTKDSNTETYFSAAIYKYDLIKKVFIDTFEIEHSEIVREISSKNWKNVDIILYIEHIGACCGCSTNQKYLVDANNKFEIMFETSQTIAEDDEDDVEKYNTGVYLPLNPQIDSIKYYEFQGVKYYSWNGIKLNFIKNEANSLFSN